MGRSAAGVWGSWRCHDGLIEELYRCALRLRTEVRVAHRHLDGGVAHQLLDDLQGHALHREVASVGVSQVMPADAPLWAADAAPPKSTEEWGRHESGRERTAV